MDQLLSAEATSYRLLTADLKERFSDIDDETLADTVEGFSDLPDLLGQLVRSALDDRDLSTGLRDRIRTMQERLARLEHRAAKKREIVKEAMDRACMKRLVQPDFTVSVSASAARLIVTDDSAIPGEYWVPQPDKLDRHALLTVLKDGTSVPGATLSNGETKLTVRTK